MRIYIAVIMIGSSLLSSCFKEIDTVPIPRTVDKTFTVEESIRNTQTYFRFYENTVLKVETADPGTWDLAFESAGTGKKALLGWGGSSKVTGTGKYEIADVSKAEILDLIDSLHLWTFDDPSYITIDDSLSLQFWEDGEVYLQQRAGGSKAYYLFQFVSRDEDSYSFRYAPANQPDSIKEASIYRSSGFNYVYFSYEEGRAVDLEPLSTEWDLVFTPYDGWWETGDGGYAHFYMSGALINNENGVRIARIFDPGTEFTDIDEWAIDTVMFADMKGAIGANWKILGSVGSTNLYTMDPDKKYILEKYDHETKQRMWFKLQIVDYKNKSGEDHHPTVEFALLRTEQ